MRRVLMIVAACVLSGAIAQAQTPTAKVAKSGTTANSWKCSPASPSHVVPVGDADNHAYVVQQMKCTATKGEVAGVKEVEGTGTEFAEVTGDNVTGHGVFVETLANGDKLHVKYDFKGMTKDKVMSGSNKWTVVGGTGMFAGAKGSGACTAKGDADGSITFDCKGTYTLK
jgi:hypothetical protein